MPKRAERRKVFIVDDHPVFRDGLSGLIEREDDLTVCGQAHEGSAALSAIERLKPEVALVDIGLPGRSGLELIKDLRKVRPETLVLVISMHDEGLYAERVLRAGGRGYVMKQEGPERILQAIRDVLDGRISVSGKMSARFLETLADGQEKSGSPIGRLSDRELEILRFVGLGRDSHEIATLLNLSPKTVDAHRTNIRLKLGLKNHTELISYAARWLESRAAAVG
jgi:DNA-binding NarL/FixJ family response regulator